MRARRIKLSREGKLRELRRKTLRRRQKRDWLQYVERYRNDQEDYVGLVRGAIIDILHTLNHRGMAPWLRRQRDEIMELLTSEEYLFGEKKCRGK